MIRTGRDRRPAASLLPRGKKAAANIEFRWKVSNPLLIAATAVVGLIAYPLLQLTWVMLK